ncbi:LuxR C-terminal-related transcriptional regulator [Aquihabitans sp. McL0605]|uniref:LuxR C-terminal-related transcriptional regulator n=1 Tax=Aquihabitans sp. McL0605 TaxID=3415671 RepID=UPI003CE6D321
MAQASNPWPLARRAPELDAFTTALIDPGTNVVVLYGPAGVGKSRLADACLDAAEAQGRLTARVMASKAAALMPLGALAPVLPHDLSSTATARELFERTRAEFTAMGGDGRLVLLVDDAHLLDTSSAVLLTQLIEAGAVFVVATIRDGEAVPDAVAGWWRSQRAVRMDLKDLDRPATAEVLRGALGGEVGADTVRRLHLASGGNPLLLRELVLQALDADRLRDDSGTWRIAGAIPPSRRLTELFTARLTGLPDASRHVLEQLALCAPLRPAELTGEATAHDLEALEEAGLIRVLLDDHRQHLVLAHPLYGEALRADLPVLRRRAILLAAADRVEELGARRREDARRVATWRLDAGGTPDADLLLQATRVARYAHDFAEVERLGAVLDASSPSAEASVLLGEAHYEMGHFDAAEAVLAAPVPRDTPIDLLIQRATLRTKNCQWGLCDWEGAMQVVADALEQVGIEHGADLVAEKGSVLLFSGLPQAALDVLATIDARVPRTQVLVAIIEGPALAAVGRTAEAVDVSAQGFAVHSAMPEPLALAHPGTHIVNQTFSLVEAGRLDEAEELATFGYEVAVGDSVPIAQIWFALVLAKAAGCRGRMDEAFRWYQEGASTARLHGFRGPLSGALAGQAMADAMLGRAAEAAAAIDEYQTLPRFPFFGHDHAIGVAWSAWANGEPARAREILLAEADAAVVGSNATSAAWLWHDAARLGARGLAPRLVELAGRSDSRLIAARAAHVAALDADDAAALAAVSDEFEAFGALLLAAEAASAASDAHRRQGQPRPGAALANRAALLMERCPGVRSPAIAPTEATVPLTTREREIASLAGDGLSSQEIADRLYLSIRTVDNHLQKAYAKLGVNKRDQLAAAMGKA